MAAKTTVKVAVTNNAAKDDVFNLTQDSDNAGTFTLDVLANDPGSATLVSIGTPTSTSGGTTGQMNLTGTGTFAYGGSVIGTGTMKIENGKISFDLGGYNADKLALGQSITFSVQYTAQMANGTLSTANVNVTIAGSNDGPVITSEPQSGDVTEDTAITASGQVTASDIDNGAVLSFSGSATGEYGSFAVNSSDGKWTYTLDNDNQQSLAEDESHTETFTVTVTDEHGATTKQDVTITVTGTNDDPTIASADDSGDVDEDGTTSISGKVVGDDVDNGAALTYSGSDAGTYGTFTVAADGTWTYDLANGSDAVQALAEGESHDEVFTVTVTDEHGAFVDQTVTITVTGTNDDPTIASADDSGDVDEDGTTSISGKVVGDDVDNGAALTYSGSDAGTYGTFTVAADGTWTYDLANGSDAVQALAEGESHDEVFTVTVTDEHGAYVDQTVTITVTGTNDDPTIASADDSGDVDEDGTTSVSGKVVGDDVDNGAELTYSGSDAGTYGTFTVAADGTWTYDLANDSDAVQALGAGVEKTETFTVTVTDENGGSVDQDVTITITGTNDDPEITSGAQSGSVTEDGKLEATGQVVADDVDDGDTLTYSVLGGGAGTYGSLTVDPDTGEWKYTLDNTKAQALNTGDKPTETFTVQVSDGHGGTDSQDVVITVNGVNEPVTVVTLASVDTTDTTNADGNNFDGQTERLTGLNNVADTLYGAAGNDTLDGKSGDDKLYGGSGNDILNGGSGSDQLFGGSGTDKLLGEGNGDILIGGLGADYLDGGTSADTFKFLRAEDRGDFIDNFAVGTDKIDLTEITAINGFSSGPAAHSIWAAGTGSTVVQGITYTGTVYAGDTDGNASTAEFWFVSGVTLSNSDFLFHP